MKLVLASQGFTTPEIAKSVSELVNKPLENINIAIINEAYVKIPEDRDKRWLIRELSQLSNYIGGNIDFINLKAHNQEEIRKRLAYADMIYIVGGKQLILPELFKETGFDELLKEFAKEKVVMGTSAGAITLGKQIEVEEYWKERYGISNQEIKQKTLGLVNFNIIPHYLRKGREKYNKEFFERVLKDNPFIVYAITDTQAIIYENGNITFVGGMPEEIFE
ncbi:MAG: type 1 glutamine amidotransferase-like domain-containing protein [Clostridia bacterium]|nr:type 1 glutamine amidotransferase-like domain-containing protein [Clostridia bacterium]